MEKLIRICMLSVFLLLANNLFANVDLVIENVELEKDQVNQNEQIAVTCSVVNIGNEISESSRMYYYLSNDDLYDSSDKYLNYDNVEELGGWDFSQENANLRIPADKEDGQYYILFIADKKNTVLEENEQNNIVAVRITVGSPLIDNSSITAFFSPNGGVREEIIENLQKATATMDIAMYSFSDSGLRNEVVEAAERGVRVRLLVNKSILGKVSFMEDYGVDVKYVKQTMHHKFTVIDSFDMDGDINLLDSTVLSGSGNWSSSSNSRYDEDFLVFKGKEEVTKAFQAEFNHLWDHSIEYNMVMNYPSYNIEASGDDEIYFTSANYSISKNSQDEWVFKCEIGDNESPVGKNIIDAINNAEVEIRIATAHFRNPEIYNALVEADKRGITIQFLTDQAEYSSKTVSVVPDDDNKQLDEGLDKYTGAEVRYKFYSPVWKYYTAKQMHTKFIIIDSEQVLTGSYNWSYTAETKNFENLITINDPEIVKKYIDRFSVIFNYGSDQFQDLLDEVEAAGGRAPSSFDPISLPIEDVIELRATYDLSYFF